MEFWEWANQGVLAKFMDGLEKAGLFDEPESPSRPVIAVLPFTNMSGDPEQEYFADGITEDIITRLAQFPGLLVLGRNTTFQFKGESVDIEEIAGRLDADYVLEGSIRRGGDTVRVTAQLLRGDNGTHLWAETYDRPLDVANLFAVQDEITSIVAARVGDPLGQIARQEVRAMVQNRPTRLSSYECTLLWWKYYVEFTYDNYAALVDVNGGAKLVPPGGAKLVHLTLCGTRCWGVVPVVHRRDPRCFVSRLRYAERSSVGGSCGPTGSTIAPAVKQVFLGISAVFGFG